MVQVEGHDARALKSGLNSEEIVTALGFIIGEDRFVIWISDRSGIGTHEPAESH